MAEKSDEEIINEVGLEASNNDISETDALEELMIKDDEESLEPIVTQEENKEEILENKTNNVIENEDKDEEKELANNSKKDAKEEEPIPVQKKQPKIYKILIGIAIFLFLIILTGAVLYFTGFFEPEPVKTTEKKVEKKIEPEISFDEKNINKARLNKKLTMLTKTEIMNKEELEAEEKRIKAEEKKKKDAEQKILDEKKKKEAERLAKMQEEKKRLKEQQDALKKEQEELLMLQEKLKVEFEAEKRKFLEDLERQRIETTPMVIPQKEEVIETNESLEEPIEEITEEKNINQFLSFINVATIKGNLYKTFLDDVLRIDKNASLCRDFKNRIEIYFGPYDSEIEREKIFNNLLEKGFKESYLVDFTQEEYEKRCKY